MSVHRLKLFSLSVVVDVKPSNVLINTQGQVKMCDFGISGYLVDSVAKTMDAGCKPYMAVSGKRPNCVNPCAVIELIYDRQTRSFISKVQLKLQVNCSLPAKDREHLLAVVLPKEETINVASRLTNKVLWLMRRHEQCSLFSWCMFVL